MSILRSNGSWLACTALKSGIAGVAIVMAAPALGQDKTAPEEAQAQNDQESGIVVSGIRASLENSIAQKRNNDSISDVITAEDIGKLPDTNVAESLQRITGVQIVRDTAASRETRSGQTVTIRGLPSLAIVNGRILIPSFNSRDFDFRALPSEIFSELIISKSPTADQIEGGLGGVIQLNTRKPLDRAGSVTSLSVEGIYRDYAKKVTPGVSALLSRQLVDGRLGVLLAGSYQKIESRTDQYYVRSGYEVRNLAGSGFDFNGNGVADVIAPGDLRLNYQNDHQERLGFDGTIQFAATDNLDFTLTGTWARHARDPYINGVFRIVPAVTSLVPGTGVISPSGTLVAGQFNNILVQSDGRAEFFIETTKLAGFNTKWTPGAFKINLDLAASRGGGDDRTLLGRFRPIVGTYNLTYDARKTPVPDLVINGGTFDPSARSIYGPDLTYNRNDKFDNEQISGRFDVEWDINAGPLAALRAGVRLEDAKFNAKRFEVPNQFGNTRNPAVFNQTTGARVPTSDPQYDPLFLGFPTDQGIFPGIAGNFPRQWLFTSYPGGTVDEPGVYGTVLSVPNSIQAETLGFRTDMEEKTKAGYARADFDSALGAVGFKGNLGVRVVETTVNSIGLQPQPDRSLAFKEESNSYTDVLPSANLSFELTPDLVVRFAAAKVLRRPDIQLLRPSISVSQSDLTGTAGNTQLKPFRATTLDGSLEWYFSRGGILAVSGFYKDVHNFISFQTEVGADLGIAALDSGLPALFNIIRPINAGKATIKGFEVNYQHPLVFLPEPLDGLGVIANYTYTDVNTANGRPFPELSRHVANLITYYEKGPFNVRLAYNWRSDYESQIDGANSLDLIGQDEFAEGVGQLDLSAGYDISEALSVRFEAFNLTDANFRRYSGHKERTRSFLLGEREFRLGLKLSF